VDANPPVRGIVRVAHLAQRFKHFILRVYLASDPRTIAMWDEAFSSSARQYGTLWLARICSINEQYAP